VNRRDKQKAETFVDIMRSAEELFMKQGFEKTSMRQIAERSGLTKGALYHHFDSKEALLDRICAEHHQVMLDAAELTANDKSLSCFARIRRVIELARDMGISHLSFVSEYLKMRNDEGSVMLRERLKKYGKKYYAALIGPLLKEAKDKGECDFSAPPEILAVFLYQLDQGVDEEIRRVFADISAPLPAEYSQSKEEKFIIDIMKTYIYCYSRILRVPPEEVSNLISLEETMQLYGEVLKANKLSAGRLSTGILPRP
jgi:AcrR family transcriptional regulator